MKGCPADHRDFDRWCSARYSCRCLSRADHRGISTIPLRLRSLISTRDPRRYNSRLPPCFYSFHVLLLRLFQSNICACTLISLSVHRTGPLCPLNGIRTHALFARRISHLPRRRLLFVHWGVLPPVPYQPAFFSKAAPEIVYSVRGFRCRTHSARRGWRFAGPMPLVSFGGHCSMFNSVPRAYPEPDTALPHLAMVE